MKRTERNKSRTSSPGFTLVELMIVIVIMVILAAAAVPVFTGYTDRAKEAICMTKLASVSQWVVVEKLMTPGLDADKAQELLDKELEGQKQCPSGGKYELGNSKGNLVVSCTVHGKTPPVVVGDNIEALMGKGNAFRTKIDEYFDGRAAKALDSTGPNFGGDLKKLIASQLKISEKFDFRIYRASQTSDYQVYIYDSVDGKQAGDSVEVVRYIVNQDGSLKKTEQGIAKLKSQATDDQAGNPVNHLVLDAENFEIANK